MAVKWMVLTDAEKALVEQIRERGRPIAVVYESTSGLVTCDYAKHRPHERNTYHPAPHNKHRCVNPKPATITVPLERQ